MAHFGFWIHFLGQLGQLEIRSISKYLIN